MDSNGLVFIKKGILEPWTGTRSKPERRPRRLICLMPGMRVCYRLFLATRSRGQRIERTTPPSARTAAPLVAEDSGLARNVTSAATSSTVAKRCNSDDGRMV
jgi:hypothetical protein